MSGIHLLGQGGICKTVIDILGYSKSYKPKFIYDDAPGRIGSCVNQVETVNTISYFLTHATVEEIFFNCLGNYRAIAARIDYTSQLRAKGLESVNVIHPGSIISSLAVLGNGNLICPHVTIGTDVKIGNDNILFSNTVIEHDAVIGNLCYFSPAVTVCGKVCVEDQVYIGPGVVIGAGIHIGRNAIIGAGSVVLRDVPENTVIMGSPAKYIKDNMLWGDR